MPEARLKKHRAAQPDTGLQSVSRALDLVEVFIAEGPEIGLSDLSALLHMNKATVHQTQDASVGASVITSKPAICYHFKTGQRTVP